MQIKIKRIIIGVILLILIIVQVQPVCAYYSPVIAERAEQIKANVRSFRSRSAVLQDGGSQFADSVKKSSEKDKKKKEADKKNDKSQLSDHTKKALEEEKKDREAGRATALPAKFNQGYQYVRKKAMEDLVWPDLVFLDPIFMVFNLMPSIGFKPISTCMRNDIWSLQQLKDAVSTEMLKAYLIFDNEAGNSFLDDYKFLRKQIEILRMHADYSSNDLIGTSDPKNPKVTNFITTKAYLFGSDNATDYYAMVSPWKKEDACPEGEFMPALEQVGRSWNVLSTLSTGGGQEWGNIWSMAESRARARAAEWIRSNKSAFSIGGENGGNPESLTKGGGWAGFTGSMDRMWNEVSKDLHTSLEILSTGIGKPIAETATYYYEGFENLFDEEEWKPEEVSNTSVNSAQAAKAYKIALDTAKRIQEKTKNTFYFNLHLNSVDENALEGLEENLSAINKQIRRSFEGEESDVGISLPTFCKYIQAISKGQCKNKSSELPKCK